MAVEIVKGQGRTNATKYLLKMLVRMYYNRWVSAPKRLRPGRIQWPGQSIEQDRRLDRKRTTKSSNPIHLVRSAKTAHHIASGPTANLPPPWLCCDSSPRPLAASSGP
ncbi:hypothetical protein TrVGV298_010704 [Trichoderma virens]|nr:hypothetical protein TrVGV298_010704 [Trichoderma virens]UKZ82594.1 hypothetical protein TrVFT333_010387 [Trichoderma virens FT-333]